jgi:hypothetical protein
MYSTVVQDADEHIASFSRFSFIRKGRLYTTYMHVLRPPSLLVVVYGALLDKSMGQNVFYMTFFP